MPKPKFLYTRNSEQIEVLKSNLFDDDDVFEHDDTISDDEWLHKKRKKDKKQVIKL
jgi:hypothetical protein